MPLFLFCRAFKRASRAAAKLFKVAKRLKLRRRYSTILSANSRILPPPRAGAEIALLVGEGA